MSEVGGIQSAAARVVVPTSSKGSGSSVATTAVSGKELPQNTTEAKSGGGIKLAQMAEQISQAVAQMNEYIQSEQRDLQFSVDDASGQTIVRVTDRESGELIRQIPNEVFLTLAEQARKNEAIHLISANG